MKTILFIFLNLCWFFNIKTTSIVMDFRDPLCGNYSCKKYHFRPNIEMNTVIKDSTLVTISITKGSSDSVIIADLGAEKFELKYINNLFGTQQNRRRCTINFHTGDSIFVRLRNGKDPEWEGYIGKK